MKLREAQLLGVLAIIAGGIIVLSLWGGGPESEEFPAQRRSEAPAPAVSRQAEEAEEMDWLWLTEDPAGAETFRIEGAPASFEVGGRPEGTDTAADKQPSASVNDLDEALAELEEQEPTEIRIQPRPESEEADGAAAQDAAKPRIHIVQKGETLSGISRKYYKTATKWKIILEANKNLLQKPEDLRPEMKLVIPPLSPARVAVQPGTGDRPALAAEAVKGTKYYDVQKGDTLWKIAEKAYGDGTKWKKILEANSDLLSSGKELRPDMRLIIP